MSYQALARKWRPRQFSQVVGQSHVLTALSNALSQGRLHHAYLFSGTRGVGKTTLARLFAKSLNCEQGISAEPCDQCQSCLELDQGRFVDLIEIDAASRTKVEDTRELLDNVQYRPTRGRFKIYLIDEVHMLSRHSFNALLKTLEEPPEHVKFLLATTDPKKLPVTILSRCLQLTLKHLTVEQISGQLAHILDQEQISHQPMALTALARAAKGSMRDALSLTDQAIAHGAGALSSESVQQMLGVVGQGHIAEVLACLLNDDLPGLFAQLDELLRVDGLAESVLEQLALLLHQISMLQLVPERAALIDSDVPAEQLNQFAEAISSDTLQLWYQIALKSKPELALAPDSKAGLEMALLRMVAFNPQQPLPVRERTLATTAMASQPAPAAPGHAQPPRDTKPPHDARQPSETQLQSEQASLMAQAAAQGLEQGSDYAHQPVNAQPQAHAHAHANTDTNTNSAEPLPPGMADIPPPVPDDYAPAPIPQPAAAEPASTANPTAQALASLRQVRARRQQPVSAPEPAAAERAAGQGGQHDTGQGGPAPVKKPIRPATPGSEPTPSQPLRKTRPIATRQQAPEFAKRQPEPVWRDLSWPQLLEQLPLGGLLRQMAVNCALEQTEPSWQLVLKPEQKHLLNDNTRQQLAEQLRTLLAQPLELEIRLGESDIEVPLETRQRLGHEAWLAARASLHDEPSVQLMTQVFGAQLDDASIEPLTQPQLT